MTLLSQKSYTSLLSNHLGQSYIGTWTRKQQERTWSCAQEAVHSQSCQYKVLHTWLVYRYINCICFVSNAFWKDEIGPHISRICIHIYGVGSESKNSVLKRHFGTIQNSLDRSKNNLSTQVLKQFKPIEYRWTRHHH